MSAAKQDYVDLLGVPHKFNGMIHVPWKVIEYRGYKIQPKLDMGQYPWLNAGNSYRRGYVATKDYHGYPAQAMPGATWFHSVSEARVGIDVLIWAEEQHALRPERHRNLTVGDYFWKKMYFLNGMDHPHYDAMDIDLGINEK